MGGIQSMERSTEVSAGRTKITETADFDFRNESLYKTTLERKDYSSEIASKKDSWFQQEDNDLLYEDDEPRNEYSSWNSFYEQLENSANFGWRSNKSSTSSRTSCKSTSSTDSGDGLGYVVARNGRGNEERKVGVLFTELNRPGPTGKNSRR